MKKKTDRQTDRKTDRQTDRKNVINRRGHRKNRGRNTNTKYMLFYDFISLLSFLTVLLVLPPQVTAVGGPSLPAIKIGHGR